MSSFLSTYREWLYGAALIWNLAMIACFFWMSARRDADRTRLLEQLREKLPTLRKFLNAGPHSLQPPPAPERRTLEEIIHFSRNPRAFNYTLEGLSSTPASLFEEIRKRLAQTALESPDSTKTETAQPLSPADVSAAESALVEQEQQVAQHLGNSPGRRLLVVGTFVNWVILALIALGYVLRR